MITIEDIRDYIVTLGMTDAERCYCGTLATKKEMAIGTYNLKRTSSHKTIGESSYKTKAISFLVHWNQSSIETEKVAIQLHEKLEKTKQTEINGHNILFIQMEQDEPISIGTDENGIFEYVIECLFYFEKGTE